MGTKNLYKAHRSREKAILRQLLPEIGYINAEVSKAGVLISLGEASEIVKDYKSAISYYREALDVFVALQMATNNNRYLGETLADLVQEGTEVVQEGLRTVETKVRLSAYVPA